MRRRAALLAAVAVVALVPAACPDDGPGDGEAHLEVDGRATVERADGEREVVEDGTDLDEGDRVSVTQGTGHMELADGVRLELREGFADADNSVVRMAAVPEVEAGEVLVSVPGEQTMTLEAAGTSIEVESGSARVARTLGVGVAPYDATVRLDSAGQEREVDGLREMVVPALGRPPQEPRPIDYGRFTDTGDPADLDPWDSRFLGEALEMDRSLGPLQDGYTTYLQPGAGRSVDVLRAVYPRLADQTELGATLFDPDRAPGETLVGAAIAQLGESGSFADRWTAVFDFHDDGATWGIVALDQAVRSGLLLDAVGDAVARAPLSFTDPGDDGPTTPTTTPPAPTAPTTTAPPPTTGTTDPGPGSPPTAPPPTSPPTTSPPVTVPVEVPGVLDPVVDLVGGLLGGLLGGGG